MQLGNKTPKRLVKAKLRDDRCEATAANETWAMDFVHDQLATGQKLRVLTIVGTFSRHVPVLDPRRTSSGPLSMSVPRLARRRRSASIGGASSSRASATFGLT